MEELIEAIRTAVGRDATADQKARGAQACRAILTALNAEPGKPLAVPNAPTPHPLAGIAPGQALDLLIAKLSAALPPEGKDGAPAAPGGPPPRQGLRIAFVPAPTRPRALGASGRRPPTPTRKP